MAVQLSTTVRNARLNSIETTIGTSAVVKIFTGSPPANCAAADSGTTLATLSLPSDYFNAASSGSMTKLGTWTVASAANTGTAGYFRMYDSAAATCHVQGTVGTSGADMIVNTTSVVSGQSFTINTFTLTDANA
jgi:hypothetical protein